MNQPNRIQPNNGENQNPNNEKRFLKSIFVAVAAYGALKLMGGIWPYILLLVYQVRAAVGTADSQTIGIIGGADGPTSIFITGQDGGMTYLFAALCLVVGLIGFVRVSRKETK